jgi:hypothetical protein
MAKTLPCNFLPHGRFWPLLGQKSCYQNCYQTKILAMTPHAIWLGSMAQRSGLIIWGNPFHAGHVFHHHHIIIMDIDDDIMYMIVNNQPG